jgi:hypothetical protein
MAAIVVQQKIDRTPMVVARVMFDGAKRVEAPAVDATEIGTRVKRHGAFWGRSFSWVTETVAFEQDSKLTLKYVEGPMTGDVTYEIAPEVDGSLVTLRNSTASPLEMPGASTFLKRTLQADLKRLKALVERQPK